jgi:nucleotide-binding universal stress UspA family protein
MAASCVANSIPNARLGEGKTMYKHILLPTDGSELSRQAVTSGILFAKNIGATVVGIHVIPVPHEDRLEAWMHHDPHFADRRHALFDKFADECLTFVANSALAEEVPCTCKKVTANDPYLAIVKMAEQARCDLIYMASHGWKGDEGNWPGSETIKVIQHGKVPVLVHKPPYNRTQGKAHENG